jgi:small subunit ribosomal protein S9
MNLAQYRTSIRERVPAAKYSRVVDILKRLNRIHPAMVPEEVKTALEVFTRSTGMDSNMANSNLIDEFGRTMGRGGRKASRATVYLVEGNGEVLVNGKSLNEAFFRVHDRESAIWPLKVTDRLDKYNVWASVHGGGKTGQAESITLALGRALMMHEPALKPALRRGKSAVIYLDSFLC